MDKVVPVRLASIFEEEDQLNGKYVPQRVYSDVNQKSLLFVDSRDRSSGNDFNFVIDLKSETSNCRCVELSSCALPLLPQINDKNNSITVVHADGTASTTLENGYYTVQSLVNELSSKLTALWVSLDATNTVVVNYNADARTITITDGNGETWYFDSSSSFIQYGLNVVEFESGASTVAVVQTSVSLQMVYSRYLTVYSRRLTENSRITSKSSRPVSSNIVAMIDLLSGYDAQQYINGSTFPSTSKVFTPKNTAIINTLNRLKAIRVVDIEVEDEFGNNVYDIYNNGFKYATNFTFVQYF